MDVIKWGKTRTILSSNSNIVELYSTIDVNDEYISIKESETDLYQILPSIQEHENENNAGVFIILIWKFIIWI